MKKNDILSNMKTVRTIFIAIMLFVFGSGILMAQTTVTIYSSADNSPDEFAPTTNRGTCDRVYLAGGAGSRSRGLFKFDLSSIPAGATITSGTLYLYRILGTGSGNVDVHRVTNDWTEGTAACVGTTGMVSNWNQCTSGTNWSTAGGDYNATVEATTNVPATTYTTNSWNVQGLIQGWVSGSYVNYGLLIKEADESDYNQMTFATREYTGTANDARLVITYNTSIVYYSKGSFAVNTPSNWNTARDGSGANAASFGTGNIFIIQNTHAMTLTGSSAWDVSSTGTVQIESGGTWTNSSSGTATIGIFQVDNGGTYNHSTTAAFPGMTKNLGALSFVNYAANAGQTIISTTYGHLTLSGSGTKTLPGGGVTILGNFTCSGTASGSSSSALTVNGNFTIDNGAGFTASTYSHSVKGNFSNSGTFFSNMSTMTFNGTSAQAIGGSSTTSFYNITINNTSAIVTANKNFNVGGTLTVNANTALSPLSDVVINNSGAMGTLTGFGTVRVSRADGTSTPDFSAQYKFTTYTLTNLTVDFVGDSIYQNLDAYTYGNLSINTTGGTWVDGYNNFNVTGTLTLESTGVLWLSADVVVNSAGAQGTLTGSGGYLNITRVNSPATLEGQYKFATYDLTSLRLDYSGAGAQSIDITACSGLYSTNSGTKTLANNITVGNQVEVGANVTLDLASFTANRSSAGGSLELDASSKLKIGGTNTFPSNYTTISLDATSTVEYSGTNQPVLNLDYGNLTLSGNGTKAFAAGTVGIGGDLDVRDLAVVDAITYNDTVKYFGSDPDVRYGFINKNLKISGQCSATAMTNISVTNSLVIDPDAALNMNNYVLTVDGILLNDGTFISTNPAGSMSFFSKNSGDFNSLDSWANSGYTGTTTTRLPGMVNNDVLIIGNSKTINLASNISDLGTIKVDLSGILNQTDGIVSTKNLQLKNNGSHNLSGGELQINHDLKVPTGTTFNGTAGTVRFTGAAGGGAAYTGNVQFNNLIVDASANYKLANGDVINISGSYTNYNSSLDNDKGTLTFNGASPQTIYSASSPASTKTIAGNVVVSNPSVTLLSDIGIHTSLNYNSGGHINKNGYNIYLAGVLYDGPTPVELTSLIASVKNNSVLLSWQTATEINNYGFEIERSVNSENWVKIGFINGYGNSNSLKEYSFEDSKLSNLSYQYRLKQIDTDGTISYSTIVNVTIDYSPKNFSLSQNYPNPFNPSTKIKWQSPVGSWQTLKVYDILGNEVLTLVDEFRDAGFYEVDFDGSQLTSGAYIYKIQADNLSDSKKMLLMK